ncbi:MAG: DUF2589 domain-containing protein [Bacteroidales bacterium]
MSNLSNYNPGQELADIDFSALIGGPLGAIVDAQAKAALSTVDFVKSVGFSPDSEDETTGEITPGEPIYVSFKYPKMVQPYVPAINGKLKDIVVANGGTNYVNGDNLNVNGITVTVTSVDSNGAIDDIAYNTDNTSGLEAISGVSGTGGSGSAATFDISVEDIPAEQAVFEEMQLEVPILTMMPIPFIRVEEGEINFNAKITSMEYARVGREMKFGLSKSITNKNNNKNYSFAGSFNFNKNVNTVKLNTNISYQKNSRQGHKIDKTFHMGVKIRVSQDEIPEGMEKLLNILEGSITATPIEN